MNTNRKKTSYAAVALITLCFVAAFFILRALPDAECGFLHYVEIVNEDGEIELCATNHAGFLDLSRLKYPIEVFLEPMSPPAPGIKQEVELVLETEGGMPIAPHELAVTHTKKMHVMLVDPSLEDYHHVHPVAEGFSGRYRFEFTPQLGGAYQVFTEVVPNRSRRQAIATATLDVLGPGKLPEFTRSLESTTGDVSFKLSEVPDRLRSGRDYKFALDVTALDGSDAALEEVMGATGHMVAFDAAGTGFAHMHPLDSIAELAAGFARPDQPKQLEFMFNVPNPGWYRLFAQVQIDGEAVFGRFDLKVE